MRSRRATSAVLTPWAVEVTFPLDASAWSKNRTHRVTVTRDGRPVVYTRAEARQVRNQVAVLVFSALHRAEVRPVKSKVWLRIMVYRANMRGDPLNIIDLLADSVKDAFKALAAATLAVAPDDNLFACTLDWAVDAQHPHVTLRISQGDA